MTARFSLTALVISLLSACSSSEPGLDTASSPSLTRSSAVKVKATEAATDAKDLLETIGTTTQVVGERAGDVLEDVGNVATKTVDVGARTLESIGSTVQALTSEDAASASPKQPARR